MATPSPTPPPLPSPSKKSRVRVRVSSTSSQIHHSWILLLLFLTTLFSTISSSPAEISYADHCNSVVLESISTGSFLDLYGSFQISNGYYSGGDKLLKQEPNSSFSVPRSFYFHSRNLYRTQTPGVLKVEGSLIFRGGGVRFVHRNLTEVRSGLRRVRPRIPRTFTRRGKVTFDLMGFWSESTGKLCMVGTGVGHSKEGNFLELSAVFKLNYPKTSNITASLVSGAVESLDTADSSNHFDTISILAYAQKNYEYTLIPQVKKSCSRVDVHEESLGFGQHSSCSYLQSFLRGRFKLDYNQECSNGNCGPFARSLGFYPSFMSLNWVQCLDDGRLHMYLGFSNVSNFAYNSLLVPEMTLVGEGVWDQENHRLCIMACRIQNSNVSLLNAYAGDCTIGFSLWFPTVLSIRNRSTIVGRIWSNHNQKDSGYFDTVSFRSLDNNMDMVPGLKYKYTEMDVVSTSCEKNKIRNLGKRRYPDGKSLGDIRFDISLRNVEGESAWGYASPLSVGDNFYGYFSMGNSSYTMAASTVVEMNHSLWNVSYMISYTFHNRSSYVNEPTEISSEGIYNAETGVLCMVGCQFVGSSVVKEKLKGVDYMDCGILINIQLSPLNPEAGEHLNGTIRSTRKKLDPLYFKPLGISSFDMYTAQAVESVWRMDIEITMVLISLTLSCIFIGLQLFYVKKHPDVLSSISIVMLLILTLGHMIPLVLNFEALFFMNRNRQNVLLWSGGWLEVNEVVVRVITMVAFLLQFRFLQVAWSARSAEGKKDLWVAERKALRLCLPLYFAGGLIAWFVHMRSYETPLQRPDFVIPEHRHSFWEDLISYAGLILDGFLLPQVMFNIFWNSKDKALAPSFYVGTTIVRALPHVYDAYRARHYAPHFNSSYIYASPNGDFFSSAWDIIIPCEGVLFAVLIYLQQKYGGNCLLPPRFRKPGGYETVPVVGL